ncbi:MAG: redoxin domain-containing protein [Candidatus Latescibacteria bacterium]|nr:redoxin domain-containing protein [Candidatus Latescibacterota bacterium]
MTAEMMFAKLDSAGFIIMKGLLSNLWQSMILFCSAYGLTYLLHKHKASVRYIIWVSVLLLVVTMPLLSWIVARTGSPQKELTVLPDYSVRQAVPVPEPHSNGGLSKDIDSESAERQQPSAAAPVIPQYQPKEYRTEHTLVVSSLPAPSTRDFSPLIYPWAIALMVYGLGVGFFLLVILHGRYTIRQWLMRSMAVEDTVVTDMFSDSVRLIGLRRSFTVRESRDITAPLSVGLFHPVVLIPEGFCSNLSTHNLRAIAFHELLHLKRYDSLIFAVTAFVRALLFFNPFVWITARKISDLAEQVCDETALEYIGEPASYARMLTGIAESLPKCSINMELAAGILVSRKAFYHRIQAILNFGKFRKLSKKAFIGIIVVFVLVLIIAVSFPLGVNKVPEKNTLVGSGNKVAVSGKVLLGDKPVGNADVYLYLPTNWSRGHDSVKKVGRTKRDGSFMCEVDEYLLNKSWQSPRIVLFDPNYAVGWAVLSKDRGFADITITPGVPATVSGRITDTAGKPLQGARVIMRTIFPEDEYRQNNYINGTIPGLIKTTDRDGKFLLTNVPFMSNMYLQIFCEGYESIKYSRGTRGYGDMILAGTKNLEITLEPEGRIEGKVIYEDTGEPAKDIKIHAINVNSLKYYSEIVTTDNKGYYVIPSLEEGVYHVDLVKEDTFADRTAKAVVNVPVKSGEIIKNIELRLVNGGIVTGKIYDENTGELLPDVSVSLFDQNFNPGIILGKGVTDNNGEYRMRSIPGNFSVCILSPPGYERESHRGTIVTVSDGHETKDVDFGLSRGIIITGVALSPEGKPVSGVEISNYPFNRGWQLPLITDGDGVFSVGGVEKNSEFKIDALHREQQLKGQAIVKASSGENIVIELERYETADIEGRVVDEAGNPMPGVNIVLIHSRKDFPENMGIAVSYNAIAVTDDLGYYRVAGLMIEPDEEPFDNGRSLSAEAEGYKTASILNLKDLRENMPQLDDAVMVPKEKNTRWIEGTVRDSHFAPVVGAMVRISGGYSELKDVYTDERGHYRLDGLKNLIEEDIHVTHNDFGLYVFEYIVTNKQRNFMLLKQKYFLSGVVVDQDNNPVENADIRPQPGGENKHFQRHDSGYVYMSHKTNNKGEFRFDTLVEPVINLEIYHSEKGHARFDDVQTDRDDVVFQIKPREDKSPDKNKLTWEFDKRSVMVLEGKPAPELQVSQWVNCEPVTLADLKGKTVLLDFWSSYNEYSMQALPLMKTLYDVYSDKGLVILAIHEYTDNIDDLKELIEKEGIDYRVAVDNKSTLDNAMGLTFDAYGLSRTKFPNMIIEADGTIQTDVYDNMVFMQIKNMFDKVVGVE